MKKIFEDTVSAGSWTKKYVYGGHRDENLIGSAAHTAWIRGTAWWDRKVGVVVIEAGLTNEVLDIPMERVLEDCATKAQALRRAIEVIDGYVADVRQEIPATDTRTDAEILAAE